MNIVVICPGGSDLSCIQAGRYLFFGDGNTGASSADLAFGGVTVLTGMIYWHILQQNIQHDDNWPCLPSSHIPVHKTLILSVTVSHSDYPLMAPPQ